jgi:hypothetical protein
MQSDWSRKAGCLPLTAYRLVLITYETRERTRSSTFYPVERTAAPSGQNRIAVIQFPSAVEPSAQGCNAAFNPTP